jgi:hypothetical protein
MKSKKLTLTAICWLIYSMSGLHAQIAITASGGNSSGSGGTASFTIGQVACTTNSTAAVGSVAQGVQQAYEISIITGTSPETGIGLNCSVFPNPTDDFLILNLDADSFSMKTFHYQLFGNNGNLLENGRIGNQQTRIAMGTLPPSAYFLKIMDGETEIKSFKIVKK